MYELLPAQDDKSLFFSMDGERAERFGVIGHLRADFDSGELFYTSWTDNQAHLKTAAFKQEFDSVINSLREDREKTSPFASRRSLSAFCSTNPGMDLSPQGNGYVIRTQDYSYYLRCKPAAGEYDIYCYAYDNRYLLPELAGQHELPNDCFSVAPSTGELVFIVLGEDGYFPSSKSTSDPHINRQIATASNVLLGVTRAQEEAMLAGSMFGWDAPAAKPWRYDAGGNPRSLPPNRNEHER